MRQVIFFYAPWCEVCNRMEPTITELCSRYDINLLKQDIENMTKQQQYLGVRTIPTFIFLENDAIISKTEGAFSIEQGINWFEDNLGITLEKERKGELPIVK